MSKVITSPVAEYPGTVTLYTPITFPLAIAFNRERARASATQNEMEVFYFSMLAIMPCVEKWEIDGLANPPDPETVPVSPIGPISQVIGWIVHEVTLLLFRPNDAPNASGPKPTST